jgi:hypothetical protein
MVLVGFGRRGWPSDLAGREEAESGSQDRSETAIAMATRSQQAMRRTDPAGRVDILVIRLLEHAVSTYGDLPLRGIYGTFKPEIDRSLKQHLGKIRIYVPPAQIQASVPVAKPKPKADKDAMTMRRGADGVYEVSDAR